MQKKKLNPTNHGKDCPYNGEGEFEIGCDECDYLLCCTDEKYGGGSCETCTTLICPQKSKKERQSFQRSLIFEGVEISPLIEQIIKLQETS